MLDEIVNEDAMFSYKGKPVQRGKLHKYTQEDQTVLHYAEINGKRYFLNGMNLIEGRDGPLEFHEIHKQICFPLLHKKEDDNA